MLTAYPQNSPIEQRARELDSSTIRRATQAGYHELQRMRASHERLWHGGEVCPDGCWVGALIRRAITRKLCIPTPKT